MRLSSRLRRLERVDLPHSDAPCESLFDKIDRLTAEYQAADAAHRAEVEAALADPERRAWAAKESERLAALETMSIEDWLATEWPRLKEGMLAGRVPHP